MTVMALDDWRSELPIMVHHPAAGVGCDDLCESTTRGRLPTIRGGPDQDRSLVLRFGPHPLRQMDTGSLARHGIIANMSS